MRKILFEIIFLLFLISTLYKPASSLPSENNSGETAFTGFWSGQEHEENKDTPAPAARQEEEGWSAFFEGNSIKDIVISAGKKIGEKTKELIGTVEISFDSMPSIYLTVDGSMNDACSLESSLAIGGFKITGMDESGFRDSLYRDIPESTEIIVAARVRTFPEVSPGEFFSYRTIITLSAIRPRQKYVIAQVSSSERGVARTKEKALLRSRQKAFESSSEKLKNIARTRYLPEKDTFEVQLIFINPDFRAKPPDYSVARSLLEPAASVLVLPANIIRFNGKIDTVSYAPAHSVARLLARKNSFERIRVRGKTIFLWPRKK